MGVPSSSDSGTRSGCGHGTARWAMASERAVAAAVASAREASEAETTRLRGELRAAQAKVGAAEAARCAAVEEAKRARRADVC